MRRFKTTEQEAGGSRAEELTGTVEEHRVQEERDRTMTLKNIKMDASEDTPDVFFVHSKANFQLGRRNLIRQRNQSAPAVLTFQAVSDSSSESENASSVLSETKNITSRYGAFHQRGTSMPARSNISGWRARLWDHMHAEASSEVSSHSTSSSGKDSFISENSTSTLRQDALQALRGGEGVSHLKARMHQLLTNEDPAPVQCPTVIATPSKIQAVGTRSRRARIVPDQKKPKRGFSMFGRKLKKEMSDTATKVAEKPNRTRTTYLQALKLSSKVFKTLGRVMAV